MIAVTGLRVSEAIALDDSDVDQGNGILTIRRKRLHHTKMRDARAQFQDSL